MYHDDVFVRGTTPELKWDTKGVDVSDSVVMYVTYKQGKYVVEKQMSDCTFDEHGFSHSFTQEETLGFNAGLRAPTVLCQARGRWPDGKTWATYPPVEVPAGIILKGGVI